MMPGGIRLFHLPGKLHPSRVDGLQFAAPYDDGDLKGHVLPYYKVEPAPAAELEEAFAKVDDHEKVADMLQGNALALSHLGVEITDLGTQELRKRDAALLVGVSGCESRPLNPPRPRALPRCLN